jgi:hypothetical protein
VYLSAVTIRERCPTSSPISALERPARRMRLSGSRSSRLRIIAVDFDLANDLVDQGINAVFTVEPAVL